ncbi:MAG: relaxase domain-containing protein [Acidimicrobiales bacterium]
MTFSAPKAISLLWAFGSGDVRDAISAAHDQAGWSRGRPPVQRGLPCPARSRRPPTCPNRYRPTDLPTSCGTPG